MTKSIATWNEGTRHREEELDLFLNELQQFINESHCKCHTDEAFEQGRYTVMHSEKEDNIHGQIFTWGWSPSRLKIKAIVGNIFQVYAPDSSNPVKQHLDFLDLLHGKDKWHPKGQEITDPWWFQCESGLWPTLCLAWGRQKQWTSPCQWQRQTFTAVLWYKWTH